MPSNARHFPGSDRWSSRKGSSCQYVSNSANRCAGRLAMGRLQSEWNSTMICILSPTALRIFAKGSSASRNSRGVMSSPPERSAAMSNGQIFIAVMPCSSSDCATSSARYRKPSRSSAHTRALALWRSNRDRSRCHRRALGVAARQVRLSRLHVARAPGRDGRMRGRHRADRLPDCSSRCHSPGY